MPAEPDEREALEVWLSEREGRRVQFVVPQRGEKRGLVDLANRNAAHRLPDAVQHGDRGAIRRARDAAPRVGAAGAAAPHRVLRHLDDSGKRDGGVDGRVRGRPHEAGRVPQVPHPRARAPALRVVGPSHRCLRPRVSRTTSPPCTKSSGGATASCSSRADPFPDLVLIDGGKGQLSAAYAALEELGLANLVAVGIAKKEELLYTREHDDPIALAPRRSRAAARAAHSRRSAPLRRDLPSQGAHACATSDRSSI